MLGSWGSPCDHVSIPLGGVSWHFYRLGFRRRRDGGWLSLPSVRRCLSVPPTSINYVHQNDSPTSMIPNETARGKGYTLTSHPGNPLTFQPPRSPFVFSSAYPRLSSRCSRAWCGPLHQRFIYEIASLRGVCVSCGTRAPESSRGRPPPLPQPPPSRAQHTEPTSTSALFAIMWTS